jgi:hypothetical protein
MNPPGNGCWSGTATLATIASNASIAGGSETFTLTAGTTTGTCTFNLFDGFTGVESNTVTVTIN